MRTYKDIADDIGGYLYAYASGDGSISFTWSNYKSSLGERVTPSHINLWREFSQRFINLRIFNKMSGAVLYTPVTRIDENTLVMDNKIYQYVLDKTFTADVRYLIFDKMEPFHVGNCKALAINFFLNNEKEIRRQEEFGVYS